MVKIVLEIQDINVLEVVENYRGVTVEEITLEIFGEYFKEYALDIQKSLNKLAQKKLVRKYGSYNRSPFYYPVYTFTQSQDLKQQLLEANR